MSQQKTLSECRKCKSNGVSRKYLDFEGSPGNWILKDHGTTTIHIHRKPCNECHSPIYFKVHDGKTRPFDDADGQLHDCRNNPEKYHKQEIVESLEKAADALEDANKLVQTKTQPEPESRDLVIVMPKEEVKMTITPGLETNPIQEAIEQKLPPNLDKKIELTWTLIKSINVKMDGIKKVEENYAALIDIFNKYFEKTDRVIAELAGAKITRANGRPIDNPEEPELQQEANLPSQEEINRLMDNEAEEEMPRDDDIIPPEK